MRQSIVLTVIGPDRTGLVKTLATLIAEHGGNWEDSRLAHLGGQFSGMVHLLIDADRVPALEAALGRLEGLTAQVARDESIEPARPAASVHLEVIGQDRPGIVQQVAEVLARQGVNVEELATELRSAPMSGDVLFHADIRIELPEGMDLEQLGAALETLSDELVVSIVE